MDDAKNQLVDRLKTANSILITVSKNPSVDQLAACIGLTLIVNKMNKHGSAVFSGAIPSTIDFLKPDETIEKTPDSLRDFIIALDKSKADKLRYKVEDQMVKIFITPYKTSLSEKDFEFSQGDFNVELIVALGVHEQEDLDSAIVAHGRILHDATVACINTAQQSTLGNIVWQDATASSLCELVTDLAVSLGENYIDEQVATALLTGIIAETNRFSNEKTTSQAMSVSGRLMSAGANQQLVATNLEEVKTDIKKEETVEENPNPPESSESSDGTLSIKHDSDLELATLPIPDENYSVEDQQPTNIPDLDVATDNQPNQESDINPNTPKLVTEPPVLGGTLTANSVPEQYDPSTDPLSNTQEPSGLPNLDLPARNVINPIADQDVQQQAEQPPVPESTENTEAVAFTPPPPTWTPPQPPVEPPLPEETPVPEEAPKPEEPSSQENESNDATLDDLERAVKSPHQNQADLDSAREEVDAVLSTTPDSTPKPKESLNAMPLGEPLHPDENTTADQPPQEPKKETIAGLDPSLFSEVPLREEQAPPVPPPLDFNNPSGDKPS
jgi:nanoRNase/pAp phosphatase (c-di-AMP/oligoRNAs hydrolase)